MPLADFFVCRTIILVFKVLLHGFIANYIEFFKYVKKTKQQDKEDLANVKAKTA